MVALYDLRPYFFYVPYKSIKIGSASTVNIVKSRTVTKRNFPIYKIISRRIKPSFAETRIQFFRDYVPAILLISCCLRRTEQIIITIFSVSFFGYYILILRSTHNNNYNIKSKQKKKRCTGTAICFVDIAFRSKWRGPVRTDETSLVSVSDRVSYIYILYVP